MSEIVKADIRKAILLQRTLERIVDIVRTVQLTHRVHKHIAVKGVVVAVTADPFVFLLLLFEQQELFF